MEIEARSGAAPRISIYVEADDARVRGYSRPSPRGGLPKKAALAHCRIKSSAATKSDEGGKKSRELPRRGVFARKSIHGLDFGETLEERLPGSRILGGGSE